MEVVLGNPLYLVTSSQIAGYAHHYFGLSFCYHKNHTSHANTRNRTAYPENYARRGEGKHSLRSSLTSGQQDRYTIKQAVTISSALRGEGEDVN